MTFDKLQIDLSRGMFASGQLYVALSRVRSLAGLYLSRGIIPQYAHTSNEILSYASGFNDSKEIDNEIESGKATYEALKAHDYDEAAKAYLMLVNKKCGEGNIREALQQAKRFLDTVVDDEHLYGCIDNIPEAIVSSGHWTARFLVSLLSLYSKDYSRSLTSIEQVLESHICPEALYVKSRALVKLERYKEADEVNSTLAETFEMATPDAKTLFMVAMVNELHTQDDGLGLMQKLVEIRPKYDNGIVALRTLMQRKGLKLSESSDSPCELVADFNSDMETSDFMAKLKTCRKEAPKSIQLLLRRIKVFEVK